MTQIQLQTEIKGATKRKPLNNPNIDMTPMVDLGFLLITFFIFTAAMGEKTSISLAMPKEGPPISIPDSKTLSLVLGKNNTVFAYEGMWEKAYAENNIIRTGFDLTKGLSNLVRTKQNKLEQVKPGSSMDLVVLIKPLEQSTYNNLVNALDEMLINNVKYYAVVNAGADEKERR